LDVLASTVFLADAVKNLIEIFETNKRLQEIIEAKQKIWATERSNFTYSRKITRI
jgi:hypothetical protein